MSIEENKLVARSFMEATINGEARGDMLTDDFVFWNATTGELPKEMILAMPDALKKAFKGRMAVEVLGITAEADRVAIEARGRGELATGEIYTNDYHFLLVFAPDGRIRRMHEHLDTKRADVLLKALGLPH